MKHLALLYIFLGGIMLSCTNSVHNTTSGTSVEDTLSQAATNTTDTIVATDGNIYARDTSIATIMKALYHTTIGTGDSTAAITYRDDFDNDAWIGPEDSTLMYVLNHITYKEHGEYVYFMVLAGQCGAMQDHQFYVYDFVFLHLTPKGWLITHGQQGHIDDLDANGFEYLKDSSLVYRQTTNYVRNGNLEIETILKSVSADTVIDICSVTSVSSNLASGCKDIKKDCGCYSNKMDLAIDHKKGEPWFIVTENAEKTVYSKTTCEETGKIRTIDTKACMNGKCVLLRSLNLKTGKTKVITKDDPIAIKAALDNVKRSGDN